MTIPHEVLSEIKNLTPKFYKNSFSKIFTWQELENLLNLRPFVNADRCRLINNEGYSWQRQNWLTDVNTFPPSLLHKELKSNVCYLMDASKVNESVNSVCKELEETFPGGSADAHIYFTIAETLDAGFGIHWDFSHNLIVQMEGSTRMQIWDKLAEPNFDDRSVETLYETPLIDVILNPGDAVFVPMYQYHRAESQTKRLSISFPISFNNELQSQDRHWIKLF